MKNILACLAAVFASVSLAAADLVIVQKVEGGGQSGEQTISISGDKARTDLAQPISVITDGTTGDIVTLMHGQKSYMKIPAAQSKLMMEQMKKLRSNPEPAKLQSTGKSEKIGEHDCEIFTCELGMMTVTYWIAKNFPNYQNILTQMEKLQAGGIAAMAKGLMPDPKDFPGMAIKTEMTMGGKKVTTVLISAKDKAVDAGIFNIPADYKEIVAPALNLPAAK